MSASDLGKKIKKARLAKKMTQSEVVGSFITRNMLSQIESGAAMPSVKTLTYLASVLDLPLDELLGAASASETAFALLQQAKRDLSEGRFAAVLRACTGCPPMVEDELCALAARAALAHARELLDMGMPQDAAALLCRSIRYAGRGLYANGALQDEARMLLQTVVPNEPSSDKT